MLLYTCVFHKGCIHGCMDDYRVKMERKKKRKRSVSLRTCVGYATIDLKFLALINKIIFITMYLPTFDIRNLYLLETKQLSQAKLLGGKSWSLASSGIFLWVPSQ